MKTHVHVENVMLTALMIIFILLFRLFALLRFDAAAISYYAILSATIIKP